VVDPVMPKALDGLRIEVELWERPVEVVYRIGGRGCGTTAIQLNGLDLPFSRSPNPYRTGAAVVSMAEVRKHLKEGANRLLLQLE
jgi:hypothetical protein